MKRWLSVRASRLHERPLAVGDLLIPRATLFPFFDGAGAVSHVLIVDRDSSDLLTFSLDTARVSVPPWGRLRVNGPLERLGPDRLERLAPLWHYDPWWLLKHERFAFVSAVPTLKATNCVGSFSRPPTDLCFGRDLRDVKTVIYCDGAQEHQTERFQPGVLPERNAPESTRERPGWKLDPFWRRHAWP